MSFKMEDVKGLGAKSVEKLKANGIDSVDQLAGMSVEELSKIDGIGQSTAKKYIENAKKLLATAKEAPSEAKEDKKEEKPDAEKQLEKKAEDEVKRLEEKKKKLKGQPVEKGDFVIVKLTGRTEKGQVFQVSSPADAKKAGIYDEKKEQQGYYEPEFVIVGQPGFVIEGLSETLEKMNYFEKKSVRIPPAKAYGKRDPQKIDRIAIQKFRKMNEGKPPELGQTFTNKKGERGTVIRVVQGRVIIDYNHPFAGQTLEYNIEVIDKIEEFDRKIGYFMEARFPGAKAEMFKLNFKPKEKSIEIEIPQMFMFQNLVMSKYMLAMDLQNNLEGAIETVKFLEIFEKPKIPEPEAHEHDHEHEHEHQEEESEEKEESKK
jgi:FKBP-type peptidyl-prolyl cis-trans isomerase 2